MFRDPSGIDVLLAPPRVEMAEMITTRDIEKSLSLLRSLYGHVVIDTRAALTDEVLAFLDASDLVLQVLTFDAQAVRALAMANETFAAIGYPPSKLAVILNRADASGGISREEVEEVLGHHIDFEVVSDGHLVLAANNEGVPFVARPVPTPRSRRGVRSIAAALLAHRRTPACPWLARCNLRAVVSPDRRPIAVFDSGVGGLTVLSEIQRRLPGESTVYLGDNARTPYGPRPADEVRRFTLACTDWLLAQDPKVLVLACNTATAQALPQVREQSRSRFSVSSGRAASRRLRPPAAAMWGWWPPPARWRQART